VEFATADPNLNCLLYGCFLYFDAAGATTEVNSVGLGDNLHFHLPVPWRDSFTRPLRRDGRVRDITTSAMFNAGFHQFAWINPHEVLTSDDGSGQTWTPAPDGGFVYLASPKADAGVHSLLFNVDSAPANESLERSAVVASALTASGSGRGLFNSNLNLNLNLNWSRQSQSQKNSGSPASSSSTSNPRSHAGSARREAKSSDFVSFGMVLTNTRALYQLRALYWAASFDFRELVHAIAISPYPPHPLEKTHLKIGFHQSPLHAAVRVYTCTHARACMCVYVYIYIYICIYTFIYVYMYDHPCMYYHPCMRACMSSGDVCQNHDILSLTS
jgi:hypothetical protein